MGRGGEGWGGVAGVRAWGRGGGGGMWWGGVRWGEGWGRGAEERGEA